MDTRIGIVFAVLGFLAFFSSPVFALDNPQMQLNDYSLSPNPAAPGNTIAVSLHLANIDPVHCAELVKASLSVSYPLSVQGADSQYLGKICYGDDANGSIVFQVPVDGLATSGTYPILVSTTYSLGYAKFSTSDTLYLRVAGTPFFQASIVSSNPADIYPGDTASMVLSLQNSGSGRAQAAHLAVDSPDGLEVKWAGSEQELNQINAYSLATTSLTVEAPKSQGAGERHLDAVLSFLDEAGAPKTQSFSFVVPVKPKADFTVSIDGTAPLLSGNATLTKLLISNTGSETANKVKVRILPTFPFSSDGTVRYLENLAPGQQAELDYQITTDKDATSGNQLLSVIVEFEDPDQKAFNDTVDFFLPVRTKNILDQLVENIFLIAVVAIVVGIVVLRRRKSAKKK